MAELDTLDLAVLVVILLGTVAYLTKGTYWGRVKDPYTNAFPGEGEYPDKGEKDIRETMENSGKNCIVFYGSQTGTAEDYAARLAKEGKSRFGLETMVADLEEYNFNTLDTLSDDKVVMFVLATYGEGEPTDNAVAFYDFISTDPTFSLGNEVPLGNLKYVMFGLGNNTYEHYNVMVRKVNKALRALGAKLIGEAGEGDDGAGTMEEDFLAWKEPMWKALVTSLGLQEREAVYEANFGIIENDDLTRDDPQVYLGEPNKSCLDGITKGPFNLHNPYVAPISKSYELFSVKGRNCLHMEIDITGSSFTYQTGDHLAIWPTNAGEEVDRFLDIFDLTSKRHNVVTVKSLESTAKVPFPTPTTFDAIVRYHMEICSPISRQFIATLASFAPDDASKAEMTRLGNDKDYFHSKVNAHYLSIARLLETVSKGKKWTNVPFSALIEGITKLQPRYYSISSSSKEHRYTVAITAVVESQELPGRGEPFRGVATNYLLALKEKQNGDPNPTPFGMSYEIMGPRNRYDGIHVPVHIRHSNFKLPSDTTKPIIMIGPGTGVAPFRAFVRERKAMHAAGVPDVGKAILFFGCRKSTEDFLYKDEWEEAKQDLGDKFELVTAFSRENSKKVYVQHRLKERAKQINELLEQKAYFYVCGDAAHMAREVNTVLVQIIAGERGIPEAKAEEIVKKMRAANQYQEDVWS
ncbi:hypothetical protein BT67DRAFT_442173 [Trichocladium antarcticum]|uniref:NADPH--cytochrome P450 reductase n=1 Tax=Trichocladium antarcticum TaxID=1450529 RepID=A0AAN6UK44_9PEZI|nr:hypothetical protein BT67DRAFT_442173 [Trichocladium antarcticum]